MQMRLDFRWPRHFYQGGYVIHMCRCLQRGSCKQLGISQLWLVPFLDPLHILQRRWESLDMLGSVRLYLGGWHKIRFGRLTHWTGLDSDMERAPQTFFLLLTHDSWLCHGFWHTQPKDTFDRRFLKRAKFNVASVLLDIQRRFYKDLVRSPFLSCVISFVTVLLLNSC